MTFRTGRASLVLVFFLGVAAPGGWGQSARAEEIRFNRDIRPILSDACFRCHGPDKNQRQAKLRLDIRAMALETKAFLPGQPDKSELVRRIFSNDPDDVMPPPETHKTLSSPQRELLRQWIKEGAVYEPHWAYIAPTRPAIPTVEDSGWVRNPIDAFILATLEKQKIKPSPAADPRTLLRRVSLDLVGLPAGLKEQRIFLSDLTSGTYDRAVQRLLASPHFGERMAVPWLDLVRFADTVGYHGDQTVNIFPYRDYVIAAFNDNKRFDQFTIEQLAGDLLPDPSPEQRVATGFNRLNMMTREGGAQPKEYLAKYAADRVRTLAATWLGSTVGCAECHDHKFDPFTAKDFYQLEAFFADIKQWGVYQDYPYTPNPDLKNWSNDHPFPPELVVESPAQQRRLQELRRRLAAVLTTVATNLDFNPVALNEARLWNRAGQEFLRTWPNGWRIPTPVAVAAVTNTAPETGFVLQKDGSLLLTNKLPVKLELPMTNQWVGAIRMELLPRPNQGNSILRGGAAGSTLVTLAASRRDAKGAEQNLSFYHADANLKEERYVNGTAVLGVLGGWRTSRAQFRSPHVAVWRLDPPLHLIEGQQLIVTVNAGSAGCVRLAVSPFANGDPLASNWVAGLAQDLEVAETATQEAASLRRGTYFVSSGRDGTFGVKARGPQSNFSRYKELFLQILECRQGHATTLITEAREPISTRILPRGNWQDESGEVVSPAPPHFLPQIPSAGDRRLDRLDLARWLVAKENPLTARTVVNRLWKQFFGAGLCTTVDDLGLQGDAPSHPELLDWLAVEFMESGWDLKHMVELIVTSSTYRQDSNLRPEQREADPANRWLAAQNPRRLEAEFVRDNALAVAGLLNLDLGGPSFFPYQPEGYYANLQFPDRVYSASPDDRQYRRGVYVHWQRTFLQPMLANFDAPSREECTAVRTVSNTPQQALTLLNDPTFVEAARLFMQNVLAQPNLSERERLDYALARALDRQPRAPEAESLLRFLAAQREHFRDAPDEIEPLLRAGSAPREASQDPIESAAWMSVCRVILNLHETITIY